MFVDILREEKRQDKDLIGIGSILVSGDLMWSVKIYYKIFLCNKPIEMNMVSRNVG